MRKCQSRSCYGNCGLDARHEGEHAVPIGDGLWFAYPRPRTDGITGYAKFCGHGLRLVVRTPHYCDCDGAV